MPELPEVETVRTELEPYVTGRKITGVELFWERIVKQPSADEFRSRLVGKKITGLGRNGKYLSFQLDSGEALIFHLKMSGSLLLKAGSPDGKYVRAVIHMDGLDLYFRDPRKFGVMWLVDDIKSVTGKLGPEPLEPGFTGDVLADLLHGRKAPIKAVLCDQTVIAGIGNMYADEALFAAGIKPLRAAGSLSRKEITKLHGAIKQVLLQAIGEKGASVVNYYRPGGELGKAHFQFQVAHRRGQNCNVCGTPLKRITVRNRGTYFCPKCQH
ncbi:MAG: bifunctional DNA-formamidopyrimidine glycosylase/DNA-(apurinic or apyrimidinic site) lyase [Dehalococcoidales bacterium]|nr:bifunctional DNA-formamidopyrimidine glycosylase/DNA-(apurinic or apyrimidinic site) lyase [Dehalococcoidales bacterium]